VVEEEAALVVELDAALVVEVEALVVAAVPDEVHVLASQLEVVLVHFLVQ